MGHGESTGEERALRFPPKEVSMARGRSPLSAAPLSERCPWRAPTEQQSPRAQPRSADAEGTPSKGKNERLPSRRSPPSNPTGLLTEKKLIGRGRQQHFRGAAAAGGRREAGEGAAGEGAGVTRAGP